MVLTLRKLCSARGICHCCCRLHCSPVALATTLHNIKVLLPLAKSARALLHTCNVVQVMTTLILCFGQLQHNSRTHNTEHNCGNSHGNHSPRTHAGQGLPFPHDASQQARPAPCIRVALLSALLLRLPLFVCITKHFSCILTRSGAKDRLSHHAQCPKPETP